MAIYSQCANMTDHDLISFLRENDFTGHRLRLLLFWSRHPQAKFNLDCIAHVLDVTHHHLRELLRELIAKGMVEERYCSSGIAHYSLNSEHALSDYLQELAGLDWSAIRNLEGEVQREALLV
jgi:predicted ArsR family transcriptional regulator